MAFVIKRCTGSDHARWNEHVRSARSGIFLFDRGYMDYHADRFADHVPCLRPPGGSWP